MKDKRNSFKVFAEWLNKDYRDKAYLPEEPFIHGEMIRNSRLNIFPSVDGKFSEQFRSPCIVFCSHYSLRFGPGVHLMSQFKTSPKNGIIFTDPEFNFEEVLAPFRPFAIKVSYCPMVRQWLTFCLINIKNLVFPNILF